MIFKSLLEVRLRYFISLILGWTVLYLVISYRQICTDDSDCTEGQSSTSEHSITKRNIHQFEKTIACSALNPDIILYNRIFKTGSTSMTNWFDSFSDDMDFYLELSTTEDWYDPLRRHLFPAIIWRHANTILSNPEVKKYVFVAHFYFRSRIKVPYQYSYINQVRDPVKRVISHYYYTHKSKNRPRRKLREIRRSGHQKESLETCIQHEHEGCKRNVMTRFFCGKHSYCKNGTSRALERAKSNIIRYYASVGLLKHLDVYKQILHKRFPTFVPYKSTESEFKAKVNPLYNSSEVSEETIAKIRKLNTADIKLYKFIEKRFWKQAKACGIDVNADFV